MLSYFYGDLKKKKAEKDDLATKDNGKKKFSAIPSLSHGFRQKDLEELLLKLAILEKECLEQGAQESEEQEKDPFFILRKNICEQTKFVLDLINSRNSLKQEHGNTIRVIQFNKEIEAKFSNLDTQFTLFKETLKFQLQNKTHKLPDAELDKRLETLQFLKDNIESLRSLFRTDGSVPKSNLKTLNKFLESYNNQENSLSNADEARDWRNRTAKEDEVLQNWKQYDLEIDRQINEIGNVVDRLSVTATNIGAKAQLQSELLAELHSRADKVSEGLIVVNNSVQKIMKNQGGMNIALKLTLILVLVILLSYIIPTVRSRLQK